MKTFTEIEVNLIPQEQLLLTPSSGSSSGESFLATKLDVPTVEPSSLPYRWESLLEPCICSGGVSDLHGFESTEALDDGKSENEKQENVQQRNVTDTKRSTTMPEFGRVSPKTPSETVHIASARSRSILSRTTIALISKDSDDESDTGDETTGLSTVQELGPNGESEQELSDVVDVVPDISKVEFSNKGNDELQDAETLLTDDKKNTMEDSIPLLASHSGSWITRLFSHANDVTGGDVEDALFVKDIENACSQLNAMENEHIEKGERDVVVDEAKKVEVKVEAKFEPKDEARVEPKDKAKVDAEIQANVEAEVDQKRKIKQPETSKLYSLLQELMEDNKEKARKRELRTLRKRIKSDPLVKDQLSRLCTLLERKLMQIEEALDESSDERDDYETDEENSVVHRDSKRRGHKGRKKKHASAREEPNQVYFLSALAELFAVIYKEVSEGCKVKKPTPIAPPAFSFSYSFEQLEQPKARKEDILDYIADEFGAAASSKSSGDSDGELTEEEIEVDLKRFGKDGKKPDGTQFKKHDVSHLIADGRSKMRRKHA